MQLSVVPDENLSHFDNNKWHRGKDYKYSRILVQVPFKPSHRSKFFSVLWLRYEIHDVFGLMN